MHLQQHLYFLRFYLWSIDYNNISSTGLGAQTSLLHEAKIRFSASRLVDDAAENWLFGRVSNAACDGLRVGWG